MARLLPYEGDLPYVFVSYSHRNTDAAQQIISRMIGSGYRVWYDEGIDPGTEWDENIAAHVEGCGYFLALISGEYLASDNCKDELNFARDLDKQRVLVYLEETDLPSGMKMRLSRIQAIHKYTYTDDGAFYDKLFRTRGLQACLGEAPRSQPPAANPPAPKAAPAKQSSARSSGLFERLRAAAQARETSSQANSEASHPAVGMSREPQLSAMLKALQAHPAFTVKNIVHGAAITRLEIAVEGGMRMQTVADELQRMAPELPIRIDVAAHSSVVTVEVPRQQRFSVSLQDVLTSDEMQMHQSDPLPMAIGQDIDGAAIVCDLAKMPHLLLAGNSAHGMSTCLNAMLYSLLMHCSPESMRLLLVDFSEARLSCYQELPHLLSPIIDDTLKALHALSWAVDAMMERYALFQRASVRNIDGYNRQTPPGQLLPRIVIVISELADLMDGACKQEAEEFICRLAQLGRAAGIHLIVATRQPTVNVITGLIKANIPSRIAFQVDSPVDSRTILDRSGAEKLIGYGDMLYLPLGAYSPLRVQGCFLYGAQAEDFTHELRQYYHQDYNAHLLAALTPSDAHWVDPYDASPGEEFSDADLLLQAVEYAVQDGRISTSMLQRRLRLGYARAGRLMDEMEKRGIIGPMDGAKPRLCLITAQEFEAMKAEGVFHHEQ